MRISYFYNTDRLDESGVTKKIIQQVLEWRALGHEAKIFCVAITFDPNFISKNKEIIDLSIKKQRNYYLKFFDSFEVFYKIKKYKPDVVYLRFELMRPLIFRVVRKYRSIVEINSDDNEELKLLKNRSIRYYSKYIYNLFVRRILLKSAVGIVYVTHELSKHSSFQKYSNSPFVVIPNSIKLNHYVTKKNATFDHRRPQLVFIGSGNSPWHGIDKIVKLADLTKDFDYHIIGGEKLPDTDNVKFYGQLGKDQYDRIIQNADIGIGTLALHRKKMEEACPLKIREYLANGLPIIIGYTDTIFIENRPDWVLELPNCEDNIFIKLNEIINFVEKMKSVGLTREQVMPYVDTTYFELQRLSFMEKVRSELQNKSFKI